MRQVPFTVRSDIDLGSRVKPYIVDHGQDVMVREGDVPGEIEQPTHSGVAFMASPAQALLNIPGGARFFVSNGDTVIYDRGGMSDRDVALFLSGSAWGLLCYQRSLLPLHASAIIKDGHVHAFTGPSGAGKSTLSAALAARGRDFFTDDVLIIDPAEIDATTRCYAGQKDLKLWKDALKLTGAEKMDAVRDAEGFEKYFARPAHAGGQSFGELASLSILANSNDRLKDERFAIERVTGAMALKHLRESVYRPRFAEAIWGRKKLFETLARIIANVSVQIFDRPKDRAVFDEGTAHIDSWIDGWRKDGRSGSSDAG
ncbi:hypothetical protein [Sphingorhabdus sp. Alg239-R122]|uniref:hypothetical protein n=1 Tax=Sphingorhabdus sp. Alg239-R122 TaxID=2305989 RepID=UPI0013DD7D8A|nr:hypothetical protein [Sphingorhabdus sp. Alg239-R122]